LAAEWARAVMDEGPSAPVVGLIYLLAGPALAGPSTQERRCWQSTGGMLEDTEEKGE